MSGVAGQAIWQLSASELNEAFRAGNLTPEIALETVLKHLDDVNPALNAVIFLDRDGARQAAKASASRWKAGKPLGPLDGVPITVKDNLLVANMPAVWGSRLFADYVPEADEAPVALMRAGGAVLIGKTNVPEFTVQGYTDNPVFGPTRNPWNLDTTPGGSSGGGVAAVAAGIGPLALCTDGGGSIRRPAAHAGLYGIKPSLGMIPRAGGFPEILYHHEVAGTVSRTVADLELSMQVMARDNWANSPVAKGPLRILHARHFGDSPVDPEISASVDEAAASLAAMGHHVETVDRFTLAEPAAAVWPIISRVGVAWLFKAYPQAASLATQASIDMAMAGENEAPTAYLDALMQLRLMQNDFEEFFSRYDVLLTPAIAALSWPIGQTHPDVIDGQPVGLRGHAIFTSFANALGIPGVTIPCAPAKNGGRIGFQICGRTFSDRMLLGLARDYEARQKPLPWPPMA